jgi:hypothetical protein
MDEQSSQFYLTLPSNTVNPHNRFKSLDTFPDVSSGGINYRTPNTPATFTVDLPQRISLGLGWDVSLAEIIYPHSWYNVGGFEPGSSKDHSIIIHDLDSNYDTMIKLERGYYAEPQYLVNSINDFVFIALQRQKKPPPFKFGYDNSNRRVFVERMLNRLSGEAPKPKFSIRMARRLQYMLGFEDDDLTRFCDSELNAPLVKAKYPPDMRAGFEALFVYCDLVSNQIIGSTMAPLLRVVPVEGNPDDVVSRVYNLPHYVPVQKTDFDSVEINIKDDLNQPVKFLYGKVIVKLHFKKRKIFPFQFF